MIPPSELAALEASMLSALAELSDNPVLRARAEALLEQIRVLKTRADAQPGGPGQLIGDREICPNRRKNKTKGK
jgi:hypothetical protein